MAITAAAGAGFVVPRSCGSSSFASLQIAVINDIVADWKAMLSQEKVLRESHAVKSCAAAFSSVAESGLSSADEAALMTISTAVVGEASSKRLKRSPIPQKELFVRSVKMFADFRFLTTFIREQIAGKSVPAIYDVRIYEPRHEDLQRLFHILVRKEGSFRISSSKDAFYTSYAEGCALLEATLNGSAHIKMSFLSNLGLVTQEDMNHLFQELDKDIKRLLLSPRATARFKQMNIELEEVAYFIHGLKIICNSSPASASFAIQADIWIDQIERRKLALDKHILLQDIMRQYHVLTKICLSSGAEENREQLLARAHELQAHDALAQECSLSIASTFAEDASLKEALGRLGLCQAEMKVQLAPLFREAFLNKAEFLFTACEVFLLREEAAQKFPMAPEEIKAELDLLKKLQDVARSLESEGSIWPDIYHVASTLVELTMTKLRPIQVGICRTLKKAGGLVESILSAYKERLDKIEGDLEHLTTLFSISDEKWVARLQSLKKFVFGRQARIESMLVRLRFKALEADYKSNITDPPRMLKAAWTYVDQLKYHIETYQATPYKTEEMISSLLKGENLYFKWQRQIQESEWANLAASSLKVTNLKKFFTIINRYINRHKMLEISFAGHIDSDHVRYQENFKLHITRLSELCLRNTYTLLNNHRMSLRDAILSASHAPDLLEDDKHIQEIDKNFSDLEEHFKLYALYAECKAVFPVVVHLQKIAQLFTKVKGILYSDEPIVFDIYYNAQNEIAELRPLIEERVSCGAYQDDFKAVFSKFMELRELILKKYIGSTVTSLKLQDLIDPALPHFDKIQASLDCLRAKQADLISIENREERFTAIDMHIGQLNDWYVQFIVFDFPQYASELPSEIFSSFDEVYHAAWYMFLDFAEEDMEHFKEGLLEHVKLAFTSMSSQQIAHMIDDFVTSITNIYIKYSNHTTDRDCLIAKKEQITKECQALWQELTEMAHST